MRTLGKIVVTMSFIGAAGIGTTAAVQAQGVYVDVPGVHVGVGDRYHHRRYYDRDYDRDYGRGGWHTFNGCRPGWTVQGGNCAPYKGPRGPSWGYR
jgi:hypothetical protein